MAKIKRRESAGVIKSPTKAMEYAAKKMADTDTKGPFTEKNYAQFFNDNGLAVKEGNSKTEIKRAENHPQDWASYAKASTSMLHLMAVAVRVA